MVWHTSAIFALGWLSATQAGLIERQASSPTVVLPQGTIIGTTTTLPSATASVNKYLGVAFAVSPPKRFEPPQPVVSSTATFQANQWSNKCFELGGLSSPGDNVREDEDCLYLNVYAPASASSTNLKPVLFWIYGGSLNSGNAGQPLYDGSSFAANQDVIVVSANYRLTAFGFSNSPAISLTSRNAGFYDQRLALSWVQQNIASFGGDPGKVTIFGESSGASSVDRLLTAPPQVLPYRAAILQSGQASVSPLSDTTGPANWNKLVNALQCSRSTPALELECVQAANATQIKSIILNSNPRLTFPPVNDDVTQKAIPLLEARRSGRAANVPMLIGNNEYEGSLFISPVFKNASAVVSADTLNNAIRATLGPVVAAILAPVVNATFSAGVRPLFFALSTIITDLIYKCPVSLVAHSSEDARLPTWRYLYKATFPNTQQPVNIPSLGLDDVGAYHTAEINMVFGTYEIYGPPTADEITLSSVIQKAWADFAKNPVNGPGWVGFNSTPEDIGCLGCPPNPTGVSLVNSFVYDASCLLYNPLYTANMPGY